MVFQIDENIAQNIIHDYKYDISIGVHYCHNFIYIFNCRQGNLLF